MTDDEKVGIEMMTDGGKAENTTDGELVGIEIMTDGAKEVKIRSHEQGDSGTRVQVQRKTRANQRLTLSVREKKKVWGKKKKKKRRRGTIMRVIRKKMAE